MYIKNHEIEHLREKYPQLLGQMVRYGLEPTQDKRGYELPEGSNYPQNLHYSVLIAIKSIGSDSKDFCKP